MGGKAFAFYFPVVESFLREIPVPDEDDREAWILAHCLKQQFDEQQFAGENLPQVRHLAPRVLELAEYMLANIRLFVPRDLEEQRRIEDAWKMLKDHISKCGTS